MVVCIEGAGTCKVMTGFKREKTVQDARHDDDWAYKRRAVLLEYAAADGHRFRLDIDT